jgi:predicted adenylyl cyclase CyaB
MEILNVEIKARLSNPSYVRNILVDNNADFKGIDHQTDTYFNVDRGRLKLREGNIENNLIHYLRENKAGPKQSKITLFKSEPNSGLKELLINALGILTVVEKQREIFFIDNVKFHIDSVKGLGAFIEIEAIDKDGTIGIEKLEKQCKIYLDRFKIQTSDFIASSYSDLLIEKGMID